MYSETKDNRTLGEDEEVYIEIDAYTIEKSQYAKIFCNLRDKGDVEVTTKFVSYGRKVTKFEYLEQ